jgi:ABC-type oligopeptide transport system substrate-binding subunit
MKKFLVFLAAVMLTVSLTACASTSSSGTAKVKCPACGHEFDAPLE